MMRNVIFHDINLNAKIVCDHVLFIYVFNLSSLLKDIAQCLANNSTQQMGDSKEISWT